MHVQSLLQALMFLASVQCINAWVLDENCAQIKTDLIEGVTSAFELAQRAAESLDKNPLDPNIDAVAGMALGTDVSKYSTVKDRCRNLGSRSALTAGFLPHDNIIVECGLSRWKPEYEKNGDKMDTKSFRHKVFDITISYNEELHACLTGANIAAYAFTVPASKKGASDPNVIVLCDTYLEFLFGPIYNAVISPQFSSMPEMAGTTRTKVDFNAIARTPIDNVAMMDVRLLHELTHTTVSRIYDLTIPQGIDTKDVTGLDWVDCVKAKDPENAESIAYFALAVHLAEREPPIFVRPNGQYSYER